VRLRTAIRCHAPVLLWASGIFILSSIPSLRAPDLGFRAQDKLAHAAEYWILGALAFRSFRSFSRDLKRTLLWVALVCTVFAASDEIHQLFVRGRHADRLDFAADASGVGLSQAVLWLRWRGKKTAFSC
jgi:hypothetical protein